MNQIANNFEIFLAPFVVGAVIFIFISVKTSGKKNKTTMEKILNDEREANNIRIKGIPEEIFITPSIEKIPVEILDGDSKEIIGKKDVVIKKSKLKMVKFKTKLDNIELKRTYGVNNLENIIMYEEHFNMYIKSLNELAETFIKENRLDDGEKILNECVFLGSEFRQTYKMLAEIYTSQGRKDKFDLLIKTIDEKNLIISDSIRNKVRDDLLRAL